MKKKDDIELEVQETVVEEPAVHEEVSLKEEAADMKEQAKKTIQLIKEKAKEEDPRPNSSMSLRTILGGDFLTADMVRRQIDMVRRQIWLFVLLVVFCIVYVAVRYQCQQDMLTIDKLEKELLDAKYKALSSSSTLTEKCRESHVLDALKQNKDSLLHVADQPPYIINVAE